MADIIFVRTRHEYDSYRDFIRLIELSNFELVYTDEVDISKDAVYVLITMNGEWRPHIDNQHGKVFNAHLVFWNLERPSGSAGSVGNYGRSCRYLMGGIWEDGRKAKMRFVDEVWVSDQRLADDQQLRFVVLGSDEGLGEPGDEKKYDFCHMSYQVGRRLGIYSKFRASQIGPNSWPPERDDVLKSSRFALNVHQDIHWFQEPLRFALFAAYGLPIISESVYDMTPWFEDGTRGTIITAIYDNLVGRLNTALTEDYTPYRDMGLRARERMTKEFRFKAMVEKAVKESVGGWR